MFLEDICSKHTSIKNQQTERCLGTKTRFLAINTPNLAWGSKHVSYGFWVPRGRPTQFFEMILPTCWLRAYTEVEKYNKEASMLLDVYKND